LHQGLSPFYFITFNTYDRRNILNELFMHDVFIEFCRKGMERNVCVGKYIIMPDHVHLFVRMPMCGIRLQGWIQSLKSVLGKTLLKNNIVKPHWQEGFFDHALRSRESYSEKWIYVQNNPVRAGLCNRAEDWPFQGEIFPIRF